MGIKRNIPVDGYNRLINSGCVILVTSKFKQRNNIITLAWHAPVSKRPRLLAICIAKSHFSYELIRKSKEFVVNIPNSRLVKQVQLCGSLSGRDIDKFTQAKLTAVPAEQVKAPLIDECIAHIECKLTRIYSEGDHGIFIGEVVNASVEQDLFDGEFLLIENPFAHTLHHMGASRYIIGKEFITA